MCISILPLLWLQLIIHKLPTFRKYRIAQRFDPWEVIALKVCSHFFQVELFTNMVSDVKSHYEVSNMRLLWGNRKLQLLKVCNGVTFPDTFSLFDKTSLDSCWIPEHLVAFKYIDPVCSSVPPCICKSVLSRRGNLAYPIVSYRWQGRVLPEVESLNTSVCRPGIPRCWAIGQCHVEHPTLTLLIILGPSVHFPAYYY